MRPMNPTPPLADVLARFPARERVPINGRDPYDVEREEAALCILMLEQRLDTLSTALEKARVDARNAQTRMVSAQHALEHSATWASLDAQRKAERRAQKAEGHLLRLVRLLKEDQACIRLSEASALNAAKRILGYTLPDPRHRYR